MIQWGSQGSSLSLAVMLTSLRHKITVTETEHSLREPLLSNIILATQKPEWLYKISGKIYHCKKIYICHTSCNTPVAITQWQKASYQAPPSLCLLLAFQKRPRSVSGEARRW